MLPILIDELASGFNVATIITTRPEFETMLGFTQSEVDQLVDEIYQDDTPRHFTSLTPSGTRNMLYTSHTEDD